MAAVFVHQRAGVAELDFQETCPSFQWPQEAWNPPPRVLRPAPPARPSHRYHDMTSAAWLDDDADQPEAALDAVDRQSWALARLVCGAALAVSALGLASYLIG